MQTEKVLWWLTMACAMLLLPSWLNRKTVIVVEDGGQSMQGWGWQNVASWAGVIVLAALFAGRRNRANRTFAVICAGVAAVAFGGAAAEAARAWIDLKGVSVPVLYVSRYDYVVRPATGMDRTIVIAVAGALCALALLGLRPRPGEEGRSG